MSQPRCALGAVLLALVACGAPEPLGSRYVGANVVILSVDTLRADHLGAYGYPRDTTPSIDAIARESVLFERAYAPSGSTWPSLVALLTSLSPYASNVRSNGELLSDEIPTLPGRLRHTGYRTGALLANACRAFGRDLDAKWCGLDEPMTDEAVRWIAAGLREPFFLWIHWFAPHAGYTPPPEFDLFTDPDYAGPFDGRRDTLARATLGELTLSEADRAHVTALYDGEVRVTDDRIGRVWRRLQASGLLERSIVVVTADHGEELGQHHDYFHHACSVHEPTLHVPLLLHLPDGRHAGERVRGVVQNVDVAPTLLELVGIAPPASFEGRSLLDRIGSPDAGGGLASGEYQRDGGPPILSLRDERWRYVYNPGDATPRCLPEGAFYRVASEELYDHAVDPLEQHNVIADHPEVAAEWRRAARADYRPGRRAPALSAAEDTLEQLRALGYLVD